MAKKPNLTPEEEQALGRLIRAGDVAVRQELVDRNAGYVNKTWSRFAYLCRDEDLRQEMFLGLMEAADKYDPDRGFRFLTIAGHYVKKYALLYLAKRHIVFVPACMRKSKPRTGAKSVRAKALFEYAVTAAEIARRKPIYLSSYPLNGEELVGAEREPGDPLDHTQLLAAIDHLLPLEKAVICGRFGIGCRKQSGKAIAASHRLHPQKIVNIRSAALRKLRGMLAFAS